MQLLKGHQKAVLDLKTYNGGETLLSISEDRTARIWDLSCRKAVLGIKPPFNSEDEVGPVKRG